MGDIASHQTKSGSEQATAEPLRGHELVNSKPHHIEGGLRLHLYGNTSDTRGGRVGGGGER